MTVSIVMPVYNQEPYVAEAIEGVLAQRADFEYELLIGEDCSSDHTREIVRSYADKHPETIKPFYSPYNFGAMPNIQRLFDAATGEFIALCEGDDFWIDPTKLNRQVLFLNRNPQCRVCFHRAIHFQQGRDDWPALFPGSCPEFTTNEDLMGLNYISTCTAMYRRIPNLRFPQWLLDMSIGDWMMHVLHAEGGTIGYIDRVMAAYRVSDQGVWGRKPYAERKAVTQALLQRMDAELGGKYHAVVASALERLNASEHDLRV